MATQNGVHKNGKWGFNLIIWEGNLLSAWNEAIWKWIEVCVVPNMELKCEMLKMGNMVGLYNVNPYSSILALIHRKCNVNGVELKMKFAMECFWSV
jgi:hypothetical protein